MAALREKQICFHLELADSPKIININLIKEKTDKC